MNDCFADLGIKAVNVPGCPPNPLNLIGTIAAVRQGLRLPGDSIRVMVEGEDAALIRELAERLAAGGEKLLK